MQISFTEANQYGRFDMTIGGVTIKGCMYKSGVSDKGPYEFISMPQHKVTAKDGKEKWVSDIYIDKENSGKILAAYKASKTGDDFDDSQIPF